MNTANQLRRRPSVREDRLWLSQSAVNLNLLDAGIIQKVVDVVQRNLRAAGSLAGRLEPLLEARGSYVEGQQLFILLGTGERTLLHRRNIGATIQLVLGDLLRDLSHGKGGGPVSPQ